MKSCDEMVNSLLERRDRYEAGQKRKRARLGRAASSVFCVCLMALLGFGVWRGGTSPNPAAHQPVDLPAGDKIVVNVIDGASADVSNICLFADDFVELSRVEMAAYYGVDYVPEVPADLKAWDEERSGLYRRDGGTGEVYWDADILNYSNGDFTRKIHLEVSKESWLSQDCVYFDGTEEVSLVNNAEVLLGQTDYGYYYAEFEYRGVRFLLSTDGLTQDEFVAVVASLLR